MKKLSITLILSFLIVSSQNIAWAQFWSTEATFSPHNTTLIGDASRFGYYYNNHSMYYMRYSDTSFFCNIVYYTVASTPISSKVGMPQNFIIKDFKRFISHPGFIGSYLGVGMYGIAYSYNLPTNNTFEFFKLSAVDRLNRMAVIASAGINRFSYHLKAFAIGDKATAKGPRQSYIMEFYVQGNGFFDPYHYAPLPLDPVSDKQEIADDVIIVNTNVIFATRDTRGSHAPVNLRISDTNNVLSNPDIDFQWQFVLPSYQNVCSELRLRYLQDDFFVLSYIAYDSQEKKYSLYIHRISLNDFLAMNNTIVSHKLIIGGDCTNLVDIVYEPDVSTLVLLSNGNNKSELYHIDPYSSGAASVTKLDYPNGNLYSIDTIGDYLTTNADMYVAMGDDRFFSQDISNGINIEESCLNITEQKTLLQTPPYIDKIKDPLSRYFDNKEYIQYSNDGGTIFGQRTCGIFGFNPE